MRLVAVCGCCVLVLLVRSLTKLIDLVGSVSVDVLTPNFRYVRIRTCLMWSKDARCGSRTLR